MPLLRLAGLLLLVLGLRAAEPELVFTELFVGDTGVDPAFLEHGGRDLVRQEGTRVVERMRAVPGWNVHADLLADPAASVGSLPAGRIYVRGVVTRVDRRHLLYYADYRITTFNVGLRLEFFDIQSGQVFYGRSLLFRQPIEAGVEIPDDAAFGYWKDALGDAIDECVRRAGADYRPGRVEARVVDAADSERVFLDAGAAAGLYPGLVLQAADGAARWLLKVLQAEERFSLARVLAASTAAAPPRGATATVEGLASSAARGPRVMVAGVAAGAPEAFDEWWKVDEASLGQWLHDALVDTGRFDMLPPLLADSEGPSELAAAFFRAQAVFSAYGDVRQDEIIGHRAYPDLLVRGTVTHAVRRNAQALGGVDVTLDIGLQLELVDRASRQTLLSVACDRRKADRNNERYKRIDLENGWRELAREAVVAAAAELAAGWQPAADERRLAGVDGDGALRLDAPAPAGARGSLLRPEKALTGLDGAALGEWRREYAIAEARPGGELRLTVSDGTTRPAAGDVFVPASGPRPGPRARIRQVTLGGDKLEVPGFAPNLGMVACWAQRALAGTGRFDLLPLENLAADQAATEVALASGEFAPVDLSEILSAEAPRPELLLDLRIGLARITEDKDRYRNKLSLKTGVMLSAFHPDGAPAEIFAGEGGRPPSSSTGANKTLLEEQVLSQGRVVQGPLEEEFPGLLEQSLKESLEELARKAAVSP